MRMTNNEYVEYAREQASKIWNKDIDYTMKDFSVDMNKVKVIPFDLDKFNLTTGTKRAINVYFNREEKKVNCTMYVGHSNSDGYFYRIAKDLFVGNSVGNCYSGAYFNDMTLCIFSYAEGDIYLKLFTAESDYLEDKESTIKFYKDI